MPILLLIGGILLLGVLVMWRAFALTYLWTWFIVPFGLPEIGLWHAAGISTIISYLTYEGAKQEDGWTPVTQAFVYPLFALIFGYIYHTLMI